MKIRCGNHPRCHGHCSAHSQRNQSARPIAHRAQNAGSVLGRLSSLPQREGQPIALDEARRLQAERALAEQQLRAAREAELRAHREPQPAAAVRPTPEQVLSEQEQLEMAMALSLAEQEVAGEREAAEREQADLELALGLSALDSSRADALPALDDGAGVGPFGSPPPYSPDAPILPAPSAPLANIDRDWEPSYPMQSAQVPSPTFSGLLVPPPCQEHIDPPAYQEPAAAFDHDALDELLLDEMLNDVANEMGLGQQNPQPRLEVPADASVSQQDSTNQAELAAQAPDEQQAPPAEAAEQPQVSEGRWKKVLRWFFSPFFRS